MTRVSVPHLLSVGATSAVLGCLWISTLLWRDAPSDELVGPLLLYAPVLLWSVWVFIVALRGGLVRGFALAAVSATSGFAGAYVVWLIWILSVDLGP